jgi:drug/metabolite transporter (DMT)-like permease
MTNPGRPGQPILKTVNSALWGLAAALALGTADFCGRFTGRALGPASALLGVMLVGVFALTLNAPARGWHLALDWPLIWSGLAAMAAPLAFYRAMTLASLLLVMPIAAAYPALIVPVSLVTGALPGVLEWLGMGLTGVGAMVVARTASEDPDISLPAGPANRSRAVAYATLASTLFAAALLMGQYAAARHDEGTTLWVGRLLGAGVLALAFLGCRRAPNLPVRWWPVLLVQGLLDTVAFFFFFLGAEGEDAAIAAVASSAFMVIGVLLGWLFLKEKVSLVCWSGIGLVFSGIALLSALG